jgi:pimeloyl-ACP methyl ester carboxylesterase
MTTDYFDLGDGRLCFEDSGTRKPALVLGHAAFLDSRMWDAQFDALRARFRVIRYDMLGFGCSDRASGPRSRRHDLLSLLKHLGVTRAHLVGCWMGGEIALDLALEYPALVETLTLVNSTPGGFEPQGQAPRYLFEMIEATQRGDIDRASELQLRIWVDGPRREPAQVDAALRARAAQMNRIFVINGTWGVADARPLDPLMPPAIGRLGDVRARTLVVTGLHDDAEILRAADLMQAGIAGARRAEIADSAHVPSLERPKAFNRALLAFLDDSGA